MGATLESSSRAVENLARQPMVRGSPQPPASQKFILVGRAFRGLITDAVERVPTGVVVVRVR